MRGCWCCHCRNILLSSPVLPVLERKCATGGTRRKRENRTRTTRVLRSEPIDVEIVVDELCRDERGGNNRDVLPVHFTPPVKTGTRQPSSERPNGTKSARELREHRRDRHADENAKQRFDKDFLHTLPPKCNTAITIPDSPNWPEPFQTARAGSTDRASQLQGFHRRLPVAP